MNRQTNTRGAVRQAGENWRRAQLASWEKRRGSVLENQERFEAMRSVPPAVAGGLLPNKIAWARRDSSDVMTAATTHPLPQAVPTSLVRSRCWNKILKTSIAHINLLHRENHAHCVGTTIERGRYKGSALSQGNFEVSEHLPIAWRLHYVS